MTMSNSLPDNPQSVVPSGNQIFRAGVSGAAIAGTWTAIYETMRVRNNEITMEQAIRTTASSAAIGAGAGAVAHVAAHLARGVPILGLGALAALVLYLVSTPKKPASAAAERDWADPGKATT